jgi:hypothetical protein
MDNVATVLQYDGPQESATSQKRPFSIVQEEYKIPVELIAQRPLLELALNHDQGFVKRCLRNGFFGRNSTAYASASIGRPFALMYWQWDAKSFPSRNYATSTRRAPLRLRRPLPKHEMARFNQIKRDFHVRALGEELARVNLDMTIEQRCDYNNWMRELADKNGVPRPKRPFEDLEKEVEAAIAEESRKGR